MANFSTHDILLVRYPFTDLTSVKVRPAVVVASFQRSADSFVVPLTSRVGQLAAGEFVLADWGSAGLNVATAVKRGIYTIHSRLVLKTIGKVSAADAATLEQSLRLWFRL